LYFAAIATPVGLSLSGSKFSGPVFGVHYKRDFT